MKLFKNNKNCILFSYYFFIVLFTIDKLKHCFFWARARLRITDIKVRYMVSTQGSREQYDFFGVHYQPTFHAENGRVEIKKERRDAGTIAAMGEAQFLAQALEEFDSFVQSIARSQLQLEEADTATLHHFSESLSAKISQSRQLSAGVKEKASTLVKKISGLGKKILSKAAATTADAVSTLSIKAKSRQPQARTEPKLGALPVELLAKIQRGLSTKERAAFQRTSRHLYSSKQDALFGDTAAVSHILEKHHYAIATMNQALQDDLRAIGGSITQLRFNRHAIDPKDGPNSPVRIASIAQLLPNVATLDVADYCQLTTKDVRTIVTTMTNLTTLNLQGMRSRDFSLREALQLISQKPQLTSLELLYGPHAFTDRDMEPLSNLKSLLNLVLSVHEKISDTGAKYIALVTSLTNLRLCGSGITDTGLEEIARGCQKLTAIELFNCKYVTAAGIEKLVTLLPNLQSVNLCFSNGTDDILMEIGRLHHLRSLNLHHNSRISANALKEVLPTMQTLEHLDVNCCSLSDEDLEFLVRNMPNLKHLTAPTQCREEGTDYRQKRLTDRPKSLTAHLQAINPKLELHVLR